MAEFAPIFDETEESVRARVYADIDDAWSQVSVRALDKRESSVVWLLTAGFSKEITRFYGLLNDVAELAFLQFLKGDFLSDKALEYNVRRIAAAAASGRVSFYGDAGSSIPTGAEVSNIVAFEDDPVYTFETTEPGTVPSTAAPGTAPLVSSGGAGDLLGLYSYKLTFVEVDEDGAQVSETAAGPASADFTAGNSQILLTGFPALPTDHRLRIYRTPASGTAAAVWKLVVEISDVTASQFLDNFTDDQIGSFYLWDGTPGEEDSPFRTAGPIVTSTFPSAFVPVAAVEDGFDYDLPAGDILTLRDGITGISSVMNQRDFTTGRDEEEDEDFSPRLITRVQKPQGAGTQSDYEDWLLEVPGIEHVQVNPHFDGVQERPGYVHAVVSDVNYDPVPNEVLVIAREGGVIENTVIEGIDPSPTGTGKGRAPIGAKLVLQTVRKDIMRVTATVTPKDGYALVPSTGQINLRVLIDGSLATLINNKAPGSTTYESDALDALYRTEGVLDVKMNLTPLDDDLKLEVIDSESNITSIIATTDVAGNVTLGKTQVLEYDADNSTISEG